MRRSPRLTLAVLLAASLLMAQEKPSCSAARCPAGTAVVGAAAPEQVSCEVTLVRVSDEMLKLLRFQSAPAAPTVVRREFLSGVIRVNSTFDHEAPDEKRRVQFATPDELRKLMEKLQRDPATAVTMAPKVTVLSGQQATVQTLEQHACVSDMGTDMLISATPSADARSVKVALDVRVKELGGSGKPAAVESKSPGPDGNAAAVPLSQFVQLPKVVTRAVKDTLTIADGQSAVLYAGQSEHEVRREYGPPVLSKIPYVNRLFKHVAYGKETDHLLVVLTPRVIKEEACGDGKCCADKSKAPASAPVKLLGDNQLNLLVKAYHDACADGRPDDARRLAIECLALDPTCFGKK